MNRVLGISLQVLGLVVWVHFLATQLYDPALEGAGLTAWRVLDPLMALGVLAAVLVVFKRKRRLDGAGGGGLTRDYLETNVKLYGGLALLHALLFNWLGFQFSDPVATHDWLWIVIDTALPLLLVSTGRQLIVGDASSEG